MDPDGEAVMSGVTVGPGCGPVKIPVTNQSAVDKPLWNDIVSGEDWYKSASFIPDDGSAPVNIGRAECTAVPVAPGSSECRDVEVDVSVLAAATGSIQIECRLVDRFRGGVSYGDDKSLIALCTRAWWKPKSEASQNATLVHEIGHKLLLVPNGRKGLDKTPKHYERHGHKGNHCATGLTPTQVALPSYKNVQGTCVLFGASRNLAYCPDCAKAARKVDMSKGWDAF
jgi:hypothetical protein